MDYAQKYKAEEHEKNLKQMLDWLIEYTNTAEFAKLPFIEQERLNTQRHLTCALLSVVQSRITAISEAIEDSEQ